MVRGVRVRIKGTTIEKRKGQTATGGEKAKMWGKAPTGTLSQEARGRDDKKKITQGGAGAASAALGLGVVAGKGKRRVKKRKNTKGDFREADRATGGQRGALVNQGRRQDNLRQFEGKADRLGERNGGGDRPTQPRLGQRKGRKGGVRCGEFSSKVEERKINTSVAGKVLKKQRGGVLRVNE